MFDTFSRTWSLMRASWGILRRDREMVLFPLLSGLATLAILATFALPLMLTGGFSRSHGGGTEMTVARWVMLLLFYFCTYFVVIFFNSALVACAVIRMQGGNPTFSDGMSAAMSRVHLIAGWALVSATVGLILKLIESRSEKVGRFVAGLLGLAWTLVTFLVVPVMVVEQKGPFEALSVSTGLLKQTWGEQLISHVSFGLVFTVLAIPGIAMIVFGIFSGAGVVLAIALVLGVVYLLGLSLLQSALQGIFQAALYLYARDHTVAPGFDPAELGGAVG